VSTFPGYQISRFPENIGPSLLGSLSENSSLRAWRTREYVTAKPKPACTIELIWLIKFPAPHSGSLYEAHGSDCVLSLYQLYDRGCLREENQWI